MSRTLCHRAAPDALALPPDALRRGIAADFAKREHAAAEGTGR